MKKYARGIIGVDDIESSNSELVIECLQTVCKQCLVNVFAWNRKLAGVQAKCSECGNAMKSIFAFEHDVKLKEALVKGESVTSLFLKVHSVAFLKDKWEGDKIRAWMLKRGIVVSEVNDEHGCIICGVEQKGDFDDLSFRIIKYDDIVVVAGIIF